MNNFRSLAICLSTCLLITPFLVWSETAIHQLQQRIKFIDSLSADFNQQIDMGHRQDLQATENSTGQLLFQRPGKFRWTYQSPFPQEIISDGKTIWVFEKDLNQVTIRSVDQQTDHSLMRVLNNPNELAEHYLATMYSSGDWLEVTLTPKYQSTDFQTLSLAFNKEKLLMIEILDPLDRYNRLTFNQVTLNQAIDASSFYFEPTADIDVIDTTR